MQKLERVSAKGKDPKSLVQTSEELPQTQETPPLGGRNASQNNFRSTVVKETFIVLQILTGKQ